jgi:hypothetical protein
MNYLWKDLVDNDTFHIGWKVGGRIYHAFSVNEEFLRHILSKEDFTEIDSLPPNEKYECRFSLRLVENAPW